MSKNARRDYGFNQQPEFIHDVYQLPFLTETEKQELNEVTRKYSFRTNSYYLSLIDWDNPDDPIRKIIIPNYRELDEWGSLDACNENAITVHKGVQHKYRFTALLLVTESCGGFCRYCFRKRLFLEDIDEVSNDISEGIKYIKKHPEINNVLLTGGDPMVLSTTKIKKIISALRKIDHVKIIRIGTKLPAFNPFRFLLDPELMKTFRKYSRPDRKIYLMCHFDHPAELTEPARQCLHEVQKAGVICVNQNPILRGISDCPRIMAELWNELSYIGVPQYYVFQGRPTAGNGSFEIPIVEAYFKIEEAKKRCSGLAKRIKYVMSHDSGKIEIIGIDYNYIYLKYHRAKDVENEQRILVCYRDDEASWLDQLKPVDGYINDYFDREEEHGAA
ncbi:MAG: KamA family radical SAM protein [Candidatus Zixiibacteriota bacterium]